MFTIFNLFKNKKENKADLYTLIQKLSILSDEIEKKQRELNDNEFTVLMKQQNDYYVSFKDFIELMHIEDLSISDILSKCVHISDLNNTASIVEVYAIVEDNHIVLCRDIESCEKHKNYSGKKLRIASVRGIN